MHKIKTRFLLRGEVWYDHQPDTNSTRVDWIFYHQRSQPVPGATWRDFYSYVLDLTQDPDSLMRNMSKNNAYKIRRARDKDKVVCECTNLLSRDMLDSFEETHRQFAALKGLAPLDRALLDSLATDGALELSFAKDTGGNLLASHAYYRDSNRSCLLHTVSLYKAIGDSATRNAIGRANRYLFWCDILRHKQQGLKVFDFGGWYPGKTDQDRLHINQFKEEFGGKVIREYDCRQILTLKGRLVLGAAAVSKRVKNMIAKLRPRPRQHQLATAAHDVDSSNQDTAPAMNTVSAES